jgi:hypothetical protein
MCRSIMTSVLLCLLWLLPSAAWSQAQPYNVSHPGLRGLTAWLLARPGFTGSRYWYDLTGGARGTLTNMGTSGVGSGWRPSPCPGQRAEVGFDGTNDWVNLTPMPKLAGGEYTLMFAVRDGVNAGGFIFDTSYGAARTIVSLNGGNWGGVARSISLYNNGPTRNLGGANSLPASGCMHITLTLSVSKNQSAGYVNGALTGTDIYAEGFNAAGNYFNIGTRDSADGQWLSGGLSDLRFYTRVLSPAEVLAAYEESQRGNVALLTPPTLVGLLAPTVGNKGAFFPFFQQP